MHDLRNLLHYRLSDNSINLSKDLNQLFYNIPNGDYIIKIREPRLKTWVLTGNLRNLLIDSYYDNQ